MAWNPHKFGSIEYDNWNYEHPNDVRDELTAAKQTLRSADDFDKSIQPYEAPVDEDNGFLNEQGSVMDSPFTKLARLGRQIVRPIPAATRGAAGVGSILPGPVGDVSRAVTGGFSAADLAGGGMERINEHPVASALDAAGVLAGVQGASGALKGLRSGVGMFNNAARVGLADEAANAGGRALAYEGAQAPMRPWPQPQGAAPVASASPIEQLMETPAFSKLPQGNVSKAKPAAAALRAPESVFDRMSREGAFAGDRTTGQFTEGPGGLSSIAARAPRPKASAASIMNDMEESYGHGLRPSPWQEVAVPSGPTPMSAEQRLAARSMERFGKKYRKE